MDLFVRTISVQPSLLHINWGSIRDFDAYRIRTNATYKHTLVVMVSTLHDVIHHYSIHSASYANFVNVKL